MLLFGVLCTGVVDVCLIPEVHFSLDKLKACVASVLEKKGHCVVCVAEGAGQVRRVDGYASAFDWCGRCIDMCFELVVRRGVAQLGC
jgi:6-phosphofructokinase 1